MDAIDDAVHEYFGEDGERRREEKPLKPKPEPEFMTVSRYLINHHPELLAI